METRVIEVQDRFFRRIKDGTKTVEGRKGNEKWMSIKIGDKLIFTNGAEKEIADESIMVKVIDVRYYQYLQQYITCEMPKALPDCYNVSEGVRTYLEFWNLDEIMRYGIIAIEFERCLK